MSIQLFNSHVKHIHLGIGSKQSYVEENDNDIRGLIRKDGSMLLTFTNSYGKATTLIGKVRFFGPLVLVTGRAFGYDGHEDGRFGATLGWKSAKYIRLAAPHSFNELLTVRLEYAN